MSNAIIVHKGRTNTITVDMGYDLSGETIDKYTSEIRSEPKQDSVLIASWDVSFTTDGADGELTLVLDDTFTSQIVAASGYMDIKVVKAGEPIPVFDKPLDVVFQGTVTA